MMWRLPAWLLGIALALPPAYADPLIEDPGFRRGLSVASITPNIVGKHKSARTEGTLQPAGISGKPAWLLAQWGSTASILGEHAVACPEGIACQRVLRDGVEQKAVVIGDGQSFDLLLRSNGLLEFSGRYQRDTPYLRKGEMWPHLLVSQSVKSRAIADYKALTLRFDARLDEDQVQQQSGYNQRIHAARFLVALNVKNRFTGDFLWVMLPVYDDRWPASQHGCQKCVEGADGEPECAVPETLESPGRWQCPRDSVQGESGSKLGTSRMLFRLPSSAFVEKPLRVGEWVRHEIALKPWLLEALKAAAGQGEAGFLYQPEDFRLASISLGWELSGLNAVSLSIRNLSLEGERH